MFERYSIKFSQQQDFRSATFQIRLRASVTLHRIGSSICKANDCHYKRWRCDLLLVVTCNLGNKRGLFMSSLHELHKMNT